MAGQAEKVAALQPLGNQLVLILWQLDLLSKQLDSMREAMGLSAFHKPLSFPGRPTPAS